MRSHVVRVVRSTPVLALLLFLTLASRPAHDPAYGMILRDSTFRGSATLEGVLALARDGVGADPDGYRADFVRMVERTRRMDVAARPE